MGRHLDSDWAGRAILSRYLTGGGDWTINNDPDWTAYMMRSPTLQTKLDTYLSDKATELAAKGPGTYPLNDERSMVIENGEGFIGHQYLHGTNSTVGGFQTKGTATVVDTPSGRTVDFNVTHTWNDVIDPNPEYDTDVWKNKIAEFVTLGAADPYVIRIEWPQRSSKTVP